MLTKWWYQGQQPQQQQQQLQQLLQQQEPLVAAGLDKLVAKLEAAVQAVSPGGGERALSELSNWPGMTLDELAWAGAGKAAGKLRKGGSTERVWGAAKVLVRAQRPLG